jgi:molybdopterin molybdotransferase
MPTAADKASGASGRASVEAVTALIDAWAAPLQPDAIPLADAPGRITAGAVTADVDLPPFDRAAADGYALRADETVGAGAYNALPFKLQPAATGVAPGSAAAVESGDPMPAGADAVVRLEQAFADAAGMIAIVAPVASGSEVERAGGQAARAGVLVPAGRRLGPAEIALLAAAGIERVAAHRKPRVRCLLATGHAVETAGTLPLPRHAVHDANGPMLAALVARDGGVVVDLRAGLRERAALRDALALPGADIVLVAGGTGPGPRDHAAAALAEAGELAVHGVALRPGESAGAGRISGIPVFLLPGTPAACLWAYELLAGRAVRRLAGLGPGLPFPTRTLRAGRKIVSEIGMLEVCPVRCTAGGEAVPIVSFAEAGLAAAAQADGFILVPEASEGHPAGAPLTVYLDPARSASAL